MISTANQWGPFALNLDPAELRARLRSLRAIARILAGPRADDLAERLRLAEHDPAELEPAADALDRLASLDRRRILASYSGLAQPLPTRGTRAQVRPFIRTTPRPGVRRHDPRPALRHRLHVGGRLAA